MAGKDLQQTASCPGKIDKKVILLHYKGANCHTCNKKLKNNKCFSMHEIVVDQKMKHYDIIITVCMSGMKNQEA